MAPPLPSKLLNLGTTIGYEFVGYGLSMIIYGISVLQVYFYYMTYPDDRRLLKTYVATLFALDTACVVLVTHALYVTLIDNWGNVLGLLTFPVTFMVEYMVTCAITFLVQCWFAQRVYIISNGSYRAPPLLIVAFALVALAAGFAISIRIFIVGPMEMAIEDSLFTRINVFIGQSCATISDIIITVSLSAALYFNREQGPFRIKSTTAIINTLVIYAINRGALTIVIQVLHLVTFTAIANNANWMLWHLMLGKVYVNSTLAMLNARRYLTSHTGSGNATAELSGIHFGTAPSATMPGHQSTAERDTGHNDSETHLKTITFVP